MRRISKLNFILALSVFLFLAIAALPTEAQIPRTECGLMGLCFGNPGNLCPSWTEYRCGEQTCPGAEIQTRQMIGYPYCAGSLDSTCFWACHYQPTPWVTESVGQPWQACIDDDNLRTKPYFSCSGPCLETPQNPRYYDNPTYSDQPDKNIGNDNLRLPIKFDWDDVTGWLAEPDGPRSYLFKLNDTPEGEFAKVLNISDYGDLRQDKNACFLKSNSAYNWQAQACCTADGKDCGEPSSWNFTTNPAPEPVSPYDPDWAGDAAGAQNTPVPSTIDWCDVEEANSYVLRAYAMQDGQKICHPNLLAVKDGDEVCEPWIVRKQRRDVDQPEKNLFSDLLDPDLYFFTGDSAYFWETATCSDENGLECQDYSQQWSFKTNPKESLGTFLVAPPDDPSGQKPVGLPLALAWRKDQGINSWKYRIINYVEESTSVSQSRPFDYPELSLNTFYQWQALSCLDYQAAQCQNDWSDIYTFKTTGQPPNLAYPGKGASNIIIPVKFDWEDVPGAKSYVFKISGDGLDLKKPVNESEISLDYPDLKMLHSYSWQVKTCARQDGKGACGDFSSAYDFQTFTLGLPRASSPQNGGPLFTDNKRISWQTVDGAKAYQSQVTYLSVSENETDTACASLVGREIFSEPKTVSINSGFVELKCLGDYETRVRACLDEKCEETGEWGNWTFTLTEPGGMEGFRGLVPCGQPYNSPDTPWNERESCQINHLFLSVKIIIDFLLFRIAPVILVILTIISALMFYFAFGRAAALAEVMSLWKAAIIGLLIVFFAWTMINLFLKLVGYQVGIFGNWYEF